MSWDCYHAGRWRRLRDKILRRDKYRCQYSLRYGKSVDAVIVHHIWPVEDYPEYAWCPWNLISLSASAHRAMHNDDGSLSPLGDSLRRRVPPPGIPPLVPPPP